VCHGKKRKTCQQTKEPTNCKKIPKKNKQSDTTTTKKEEKEEEEAENLQR
jgi:hypothetical protein